MTGHILLPPKNLKSLILWLEDQLEIARSLPGSEKEETRIEQITHLLDRARQLAEIEGMVKN